LDALLFAAPRLIVAFFKAFVLVGMLNSSGS